MASVVNFASRNLLNRVFLNRHKLFCLRSLSTGSKDKASNVAVTESKPRFEPVPDFSKPLENKNWVSYGFSEESEEEDRVSTHVTFFLFVSVFLVYGSLFFIYMPDYQHRDWARREAFIRLHERERLGLEPVDCNYVDPSKVHLPSDEELGNTDIII